MRLFSTFRRSVVLALLVLPGLVAPAAAQLSPRYTFTNIADTRNGFSSFFFGAPSLNNAGVVGFVGDLAYNAGELPRRGVFKGSGGAVTTIAVAGTAAPTSGQTWDTFLFGSASINAMGVVAFQGTARKGDNSLVRGLFKGSGGAITSFADTDGIAFDFFSPSPPLNASGQTAYHVVLDNNAGTALYVTQNGVPVKLGQTGGLTGWNAFYENEDINTSGQVAFIGATWENNFEQSVYRYNPTNGSFTTIANGAGRYSRFGTPSLNDAGQVAFWASLDAGGEGIYVGDGTGSVRTVAETGAVFTSLSALQSSPAINGRGDVAFLGTVNGKKGLYTGSDPINDRILQVGDTLFGGEITDIKLFRDGLNDNGDVAFTVSLFATGLPEVVVRANRIQAAPPTWRLAWQNTVTGDVSYWRMSGTSLVGTGLLAQGVPSTWRLFGNTQASGTDAGLLWHNTQGGDVTRWTLSNLVYTGWAYLYRGVPSAWVPAPASLPATGTGLLFWRNTGTGDVSYWEVTNGQATPKNIVYAGVPLAWQIEATTDLDGNGSVDLIWRNTTTGDVTYWLMNGATKLSDGYLYRGVPLAWRIGAVADVDGDGQGDLIWQNSGTGDVTYWRMQGVRVAGTGTLYRGVPPEWQLRAAF